MPDKSADVPLLGHVPTSVHVQTILLIVPPNDGALRHRVLIDTPDPTGPTIRIVLTGAMLPADLSVRAALTGLPGPIAPNGGIATKTEAHGALRRAVTQEAILEAAARAATAVLTTLVKTGALATAFPVTELVLLDARCQVAAATQSGAKTGGPNGTTVRAAATVLCSAQR